MAGKTERLQVKCSDRFKAGFKAFCEGREWDMSDTARRAIAELMRREQKKGETIDGD